MVYCMVGRPSKEVSYSQGNRRSHFSRAVHSHHLPRQRRYICIVSGEENPEKLPFPFGLRHPAGGGPSRGHRQHTQKFGKDRACGSGDIMSERQTDSTDATDHNTSPPLPRAK